MGSHARIPDPSENAHTTSLGNPSKNLTVITLCERHSKSRASYDSIDGKFENGQN